MIASTAKRMNASVSDPSLERRIGGFISRWDLQMREDGKVAGGLFDGADTREGGRAGLDEAVGVGISDS